LNLVISNLEWALPLFWVLSLEVLADFLSSGDEILEEALVILIVVQVILSGIQVVDLVLNKFVFRNLWELDETGLENVGSVDHESGFSLSKRL